MSEATMISLIVVGTCAFVAAIGFVALAAFMHMENPMRAQQRAEQQIRTEQERWVRDKALEDKLDAIKQRYAAALAANQDKTP